MPWLSMCDEGFGHHEWSVVGLCRDGSFPLIEIPADFFVTNS